MRVNVLEGQQALTCHTDVILTRRTSLDMENEVAERQRERESKREKRKSNKIVNREKCENEEVNERICNQ